MVNVISLNVNGLLNPVKQKKILAKLKKENIDIAFIQETHMSGTEHEKLLRQGFKYVFYSSNGSRHTRGVAILISGRIVYEHMSTIKDKEGRYILIRGRIGGNLFTFYNVYIPPGSGSDFYLQTLDRIATEAQGTLLCGGDFNVTLEPHLDSSGTRIGQSKKTTRKINSIISELGLIDVWRQRNPTVKDYTFFSAPHSTYSRIDFFLIFGTDNSRVQKCHIGTMDLSDHCPVYLTLSMTSERKLTFWRFNSSILNEQNIEWFTKEVSDYIEFNDNGEVDPPVLWDACKAVMRGKVMAITSLLKKARAEKLTTFQAELKILELKHKESIDPKIKVEITKKINQIEEIYTQEIQKKLIYTKQKYYEGGSKYAKLLAYKLRKRQADNTIYKIRDHRTKVTHHQMNEIRECFKDYYENLYSQPPVEDDQKMETMLESLNLPTLTEAQNVSLTHQITEEEIYSAIARLKANKSPGTDGFTSEWYKSLKGALTPILLKTFNWVLSKGVTPASWKEAIISVIPKGGKDKLDCANYRPISVLNLDYKLFTSIIAKRLEMILPKIINLDQTGFIVTRQTHDSIRRSLQVIRHINQNKTQAMLISLDAEKAFDSVRWKFLFKVMEKFGFDPVIIKTLEALYNKPSARLKINGELTDSFQLERSTRQGCPISPLLFAIFAEPLAQLIRQNNEIKGIKMEAGEQKLALFADDVLVYLSSPTDSLPVLMSMLDEYGSYSGYKVNERKTQILNFHYYPPQYLRSKYQMCWDKKVIKYLGILLPKDLSKLEEINYGPLMKEITADINRWNLIPYLNISSRIDSVKMNILPRLLYFFQSVPIEKTEQYFNDLDKVISRFIWGGRKPRIKFKTLQLAKENGGLGLPCLRDYYRAAQIRPLVGWCTPSYNSRWKEIESSMGRRIPINTLVGDPFLTDCLSDPSNPWITSSLKTWGEVVRKNHLRDRVAIFRWLAYDPDFIPSKHDIRFKSWVLNGLTAHCTLLNQGVMYSFQDLKEKFNLQNQDHFRYLQIRNFIGKTFPKHDPAMGMEIIEIFQNAYRDGNYRKVISRMYQALQLVKGGHTMYIKERWEAEGGSTITPEEWVRICEQQWRTTSSPSWREFSWKNVTRFFCTPAQKASYSTQTSCWRSCGNAVANHFHVFWSCPSVVPFWRKVHEVLEKVFETNINFDFKTMYLGDLEELHCMKRDQYLLRVLLVAGKKALTKKWLKPDMPTMNEWIDLIYSIYKMERITFRLRTRIDDFEAKWSGWLAYMSTIRPDFI